MGKRIGEHYEIADLDTNMLGVGGMGTVYLGTDIRTGDTVAIKELKSEALLNNPDVLERFEREADALRMLNHPNIVKVLASFADGEHHYIAMDYVAGGSLRDLMDDQPQLPIERVLEISLDLADALTRAHRLKVIHRDIKPANVLIADDGTPRLTDFGVARIDEKTRMTETGMVVGTLSYLSPESLDGQRPDERQDIWAFGVMLYEMVAGSRPFDGDTASSVITSILTKEAPNLNELRPDAPPELKRLIESLLVKDPDARISSIRRVGTEIENIIRGVDSDEYDIDSDLVHEIKESEKSRFEADSDELTPTLSLSSRTNPAAQHMAKHAGVTIMQNQSGEEVLVMPTRVAIKGRKFMLSIIGLMLITIIGLVLAVKALKNDTVEADTTSWVDDMPPVNEDEYMVLFFLSPDIVANEEKNKEAENAIFDAREALQMDVPFSNIRVETASVTPASLMDANRYFSETQATLMVWAELEDDVIDYWIQGGNPNQEGSGFEPLEVSELSTAEVAITGDDQGIAPYILGSLNIVHAANGDIFEFMRTFAILEEVQEIPAELESGGTGEHYFNFFNQFLNDTPAAIEHISEAIALDGGNPLWYAMRGVGYMRLNNIEQSTIDAKTAQRIGPDGWSIPLIVQATSSEQYGQDIDLLDTILENKEDWFVYYLRSTFYYSSNDLDAAWEDVQASIENNPQANYPYVTGFLIAIRQGRVQDAGDMMAQMVANEPDPTLGNRVYEATFGDTNIDVMMSGKLYEGFGNIVIGQYDPVIEFAEQFHQETPQIDDMMQTIAENKSDTNTQVYFPGDFMMMTGLSYCALEEYDTALTWLSRGIEMDATSPLLRFVRTSVANKLQMTDLLQEDVAALQGISEEIDQLVEAGMNSEITCNDFFDYFVGIGDT